METDPVYFFAGIQWCWWLQVVWERQWCWMFPTWKWCASGVIKPLRTDHLLLIAVGETGTGNEEQFEVANGMAKVCQESGCDLVLLLGDNIIRMVLTQRRIRSLNYNLYRYINRLRNLSFPVLGNHVVKLDAPSQLIYSLKSASLGMHNYEYSFGTEDARFYGPNTNCPYYSERLRKKLNQGDEEVKANKGKIPWTIAFGHHSIYSIWTHGDVDLLKRSYWNLFLEGRVDLYLAGHNYNLTHLQSKI